MDEIVKQAMAKWPNVPACYGWLALDARGAWRMRDERAQALGLAGDKIMHAALLAFIHRNYAVDARGCWYFQNGPQRVYVDLDATPHIAHSDPVQGFVLHDGLAITNIDAVWLTETGRLLLQSQGNIALLDDRDMVACIACLHIAGEPASDDALLAWLADDSGQQASEKALATQLAFAHQGRAIAVQRILYADIAAKFGFVSAPRADY